MAYTFESSGKKEIFVNYADANGLESGPRSASISVGDDTAPSFDGLTTVVRDEVEFGTNVDIGFVPIPSQADNLEWSESLPSLPGTSSDRKRR